MSIKTEVWGKSPKGKDVHKFTMTNAMGASVTVIEWGAICTSIIVPDAGGNMDDVAYVRFAAVYRKFTDVGTFMNELQKLVDEKI